MSRPVGVSAMATQITRRLEGLPRLEAKQGREIRRQISDEIKNADPRQVVDLALRLLESGVPGSDWIAYELILHHGAALSSLRARDLKRLHSPPSARTT